MNLLYTNIGLTNSSSEKYLRKTTHPSPRNYTYSTRTNSHKSTWLIVSFQISETNCMKKFTIIRLAKSTQIFEICKLEKYNKNILIDHTLRQMKGARLAQSIISQNRTFLRPEGDLEASDPFSFFFSISHKIWTSSYSHFLTSRCSFTCPIK